MNSLPATPRSRPAGRTRRIGAAVALLAAGLVAGPAAAAEPTTTGPSSSQTPYVVPVATGVQTVSLLTVGDAVGADDYRMVGIPDGLGAYANGDGTFGLFMNHELDVAQGIARDHGAAGA